MRAKGSAVPRECSLAEEGEGPNTEEPQERSPIPGLMFQERSQYLG